MLGGRSMDCMMLLLRTGLHEKHWERSTQSHRGVYVHARVAHSLIESGGLMASRKPRACLPTDSNAV